MQNSSSIASSKGFFAKLSDGDYGLAKTYWLFGFLAGLAVRLFTIFITSTALLFLLAFVFAVYQIPVVMGTWRAASKYTGPKVWAVLAKIAVVLGVIVTISSLIAVLIVIDQGSFG